MKNTQPYKVKASISLDKDVIKHIKSLAENDDRNFSQYINLVLKKHIPENRCEIFRSAE